MRVAAEEKSREQEKRQRCQAKAQRYARERGSRKEGGKEGLSKKGRRADALALRADERRDKLRKAAGRGKCLLIRGYLNGETHMERLHVSMRE